MPPIRTYTLDHYTVPSPDGSNEIVLSRPLAVTVGTQSLEPDVRNGKTFIRLSMNTDNPLLEQKPRVRIKIVPRESSAAERSTALVFEDPAAVELSFDDETFLTERKEMPLWLVEVLEFAAQTLRAHHELNQRGVCLEDID